MIQLGVDWSREPDILELWTDRVTSKDVLQLTVEQAFSSALPESWEAGLDRAAERGDVVAHAVMGSPFSTPRHALISDWLERTRAVLKRWPARWLIDHVGCSLANDVFGAPLPLPSSAALIDVARDHLDWVQQELCLPAGLENLALAVSSDDVLLQPELVERILEPIDGVLLLDLHNLLCQAVNYEMDPLLLLERWPLDRVRQIHVAGGSWKNGMRRDTHDGPVPEEVFALLPEAVKRCANLEVIVLERIGGSGHPAVADELERLRRIEFPRSAPFQRMDCELALRTEPPEIQHALFAAVATNDPMAIERIAPGWWSDDRSWVVAVELLQKWGRPLPT